jgi:AraC-like DNA-binding protein
VEPSNRVAPNLPKRIANRDRERIAEAYESGLSFADVAEKEGLARSTVMRIVRAQGVPVRPWGVKYQAEDQEQPCQQ